MDFNACFFQDTKFNCVLLLTFDFPMGEVNARLIVYHSPCCQRTKSGTACNEYASAMHPAHSAHTDFVCFRTVKYRSLTWHSNDFATWPGKRFRPYGLWVNFLHQKIQLWNHYKRIWSESTQKRRPRGSSIKQGEICPAKFGQMCLPQIFQVCLLNLSQLWTLFFLVYGNGMTLE